MQNRKNHLRFCLFLHKIFSVSMISNKILMRQFLAALRRYNAVFDQHSMVAKRLGAAHIVGDGDHCIAALLVEQIKYPHQFFQSGIVLTYRGFV